MNGDARVNAPPVWSGWFRGPGALLCWLLLPLPLWWLLGLGALIFPLLAIAMLWSLAGRRQIEVPAGFGFWLVFCLVVLASFAALGVDPAGTVAEDWWQRLPGAVYRLGGYVSVGVICLYAVNLTEEQFPRRRLVTLLAYSAVVTVAGGVLGAVAGAWEFTSPLEALLPEPVARNGFVRSLVHPQAAQVMDFLGYPTPRPAAPWGYTNTWGNVLAITAPWLAVAVLCFPVRPLLRWAGLATLAIALVPAVLSMNRGLWLNLAVAAGVVAIRLAVRGRWWPVGLLTVTGLCALFVVAVTPLGSVVAQRVANGHSDGGRGYSTVRAIESMDESPVLGFGSTRKTQGSAASIAIGPTQDCPRCGGRTLGGNGQLWQVMFAHGLAGAVAYVGFLGAILWRFRRDHSAVGIVGSIVMILSLTSMFYYNALLPPLVFTMLAYALLWRNERDGAEAAA